MTSNLSRLIKNTYAYLNALYDKKCDDFYNEYYKNRKCIHVVGNGWASYYFAKNIDKSKYKVITIAPNKKVLDTPKLVKLFYDENTKYAFDNPYSEIILDKVVYLDKKNKQILLSKSDIPITYDDIVFAIGSEPNDYNISGVKEYGHFLKQVKDATAIKNIIPNINDVVIIGSGPTGIELASVLKKHYHKEVYLIEGSNDILPGFSNNTKSEICKELNDSNIRLFTNNLVNEVTRSSIYTQNYKLPYDMVIWTGGVRFNGYKKTILFNKLNEIKTISPRGIETNDDFSIGDEKNIFCIGDMVSNKGPPTAQNAKQHGIWLARYFNNYKQIQEKYEYKEQGRLLHLYDKTYLESDYYNDFLPTIMNIIV